METSKDTAIDISCAGTVTCVECSPFEYCDSLICYSSYASSTSVQPTHNITVAKLHPKREGQKMLEILIEWPHDKPTSCLSWSPKTFLESLPHVIVLCAGGLNGEINLLTTDLRDDSNVELLGSHRKSVNSITFDHEGGELLASVGDDYKCIVWNTQHRRKHCEIPLKSAGVDVKFHQDDNTKLAIAESSGLILFYDVISLAVYMSVDCFTKSMLKSIDWPLYDITRVDALTSSEWCTFEPSKSCLPVITRSLQQLDDSMVGGQVIKMCPSSSKLTAVATSRQVTILVRSEDADDEMVVSQVSRAIGSGLSWHINQRLLLCGGDNKLTAIFCDDIL